ncbi:MAG: TorF family putative porin [Desulfobacterales bacterium]
MKKWITIAAALIALSGTMVFAAEPNNWNDPETASGSVWLTTDYVFRGVSNTDEHPAAQASLDYTFKGLYLGIWGSNTSFSDAGIEIDYYAGYAASLGKLDYDLMAVYYGYPEAQSDVPEHDYLELHLGLSYKLEGVPFEPVLGVGYNYSPDFFGEDGAGHYFNGMLDLTLPYGLVLGAELGYQDVEGDKSTGSGLGMDGDDGFEYAHWRISLSKEIPDWFTLDLSYHDSDDDAEDFFGKIADSRVVFTVSRTF